MANYAYAHQKFEPKEMARIVGTNLQISTKTSVEIAAFIRGKQIDKAISYLEEVAAAKKAIPFLRHAQDVPHRKGKGMRTGRFPKVASEQIIDLLNGLKSNAQNQGLDTSKMIIIHAAAQKGSKAFHYGRRRVQRKNTHFEIIAKQVEEIKKRKKVSAAPKEQKPAEKKEEVSKAQPETKEVKAVSAAPRSKGAPE